VVAAYGWDDLIDKLQHGFYTTKQGERFTIHPDARAEILARLLALNHERYAEEVAQGLHDKKQPKRSTPKRRRHSKSQPSTPTLFDTEKAPSLPGSLHGGVPPMEASQLHRRTPLSDAGVPARKSRIDHVRFIPASSVQSSFEITIDHKLEARFPQFIESLVRSCIKVQQYAIECFRDAIWDELKERFKDAFEWQGEGDFTLLGTEYTLSINANDADALGYGTLACRFRKARAPAGAQDYVEDSRTWNESLTTNAVSVAAEASLKDFVPIVLELAERLVANVNMWLERRLTRINEEAGTKALCQIQELLTRTFGETAKQIYLYAYGLIDEQFRGSYLLNDKLFGSVVARIKAALSHEISRAQQIAALIGTAMDIDMTESRKALMANKWKVLPPPQGPRLYKGTHRALVKGEEPMYGGHLLPGAEKV